MTFVKSQSFCGGQNGLTILAKIIFKSLENIFDFRGHNGQRYLPAWLVFHNNTCTILVLMNALILQIWLGDLQTRTTLDTGWQHEG